MHKDYIGSQFKPCYGCKAVLIKKKKLGVLCKDCRGKLIIANVYRGTGNHGLIQESGVVKPKISHT